jgi:hypothetical protein
MRQQLSTARVGRLASAIALVLSGATVATVVNAQQPDAADEAADRSLEEITVTGSRIRRDDFSSPQNLGVNQSRSGNGRRSAERQSQFSGRECR